MSARPSCGHSTCAQAWIDTGDPRCTATRETFRLDSSIVGTALAIRAALPGIGLSDALTYADASTVEGRAFRSCSGFCGLGFTREAFAFGLAWYATLWGPISPRLARIAEAFRVRLGCIARLASEDEETKRAYGSIVRSQPVEALIVAWERFAKRAKRRGLPIPRWPGLAGMRPHDSRGGALPIPCFSWQASDVETVRAWFASIGFAPEALEAFAPRGRGEAYEHMRAMLAPIPSVNVNASEVQS